MSIKSKATKVPRSLGQEELGFAEAGILAGMQGAARETERRVSRLEGWGADIDASKWHMIVRVADGFIVKAIPRHVPGTLRGEVPTGCELVEVDEPSPEQKQLYRSLNGKVKGRAVVPFNPYARDMAQTEIVDGQTSNALAQGFEYQGIVVSLSVRAIAKYTAANARAGSLKYPYVFSSIDNLQSLELKDMDAMIAFTSAVLDYYLATLAAGDAAKAGE